MASRKKEKKLIRSLDSVGFYSDFDKSPSLFAALVRSPSPFGKIKSITISDLPEGYYFFTEKDIPGTKTLKINKTQIKVFGSKNINYTGEVLGIIAGPDERVVLSLLDKVSINLDVENLETALENVMKNNENLDEGDSFSDVVDQINEMPSLNTVIAKTQVEENPNVTISTREVKFGLYKVFDINKADEMIFGTNNETFVTSSHNIQEGNVFSSSFDNQAVQTEQKEQIQTEQTAQTAQFSEERQEIQDKHNIQDNLESQEEQKSLENQDLHNSQDFSNKENQTQNESQNTAANEDNSPQNNVNSQQDNAAKKSQPIISDLIYFDDTWEQEISAQSWQETEGVFCYTESSEIHIYVPTKWTYLTQNAVSQVLGIPVENVFIHKTKSSGSYPTGLWKTTQIALQAAVASYITKKPIKLSLTQKEQDLYMKPGVCTKFNYKVAVKPDGHIFAMKITIDIDVGADNPFAQEITDRITLASCNYYKTENLYISTNTHTSRNPPTTISIKVADSQAFFAIENEMQKISSHINILPDEMRLLNANVDSETENNNKIIARLSKKNNLYKAITFPFDIQVGNINHVLAEVIKKSDFNRKYASFQMEANARTDKNTQAFFALPLRGIGLASGYVVSGYNGDSAFDYNTKIEVTLTTDDHLIIHCIKPSEEIQRIWRKTACDILQIPQENIIINSDFQIDQLPENPEDTNSSLGIINELIKRCCTDIQKKRFHQPLPLSSKRSVPRTSKAKWNKEEFSGTPYLATSFAGTVVELELDTYTYNEKIKGIWVTIDCGEVFDEQAAIKTIKLEIQQELGMLVKGKSVTCDKININFIKSNNKSGQIGALIHNTLPAAFSSALSLALVTQLTELPCTEDLLFNLIQNRTKA